MADYIQGKTDLRAEANRDKNTVLVRLFTLFYNSVFGETVESTRNRQDTELTIDR